MTAVHQQTSDDRPTEQVDFFTGIGVVIDQTSDDILTELPKLLVRIATAHRSKNATALKLSYEALSRHLSGMQGVANSVVRQTVGFINRRPR